MIIDENDTFLEMGARYAGLRVEETTPESTPSPDETQDETEDDAGEVAETDAEDSDDLAKCIVCESVEDDGPGTLAWATDDRTLCVSCSKTMDDVLVFIESHRYTAILATSCATKSSQKRPFSNGV
ncbi:MAG: hypothetical protein IPM54_25180 [Polyangiaceae bacterium]|nr:hypothetical protein [Polyangiaceae bacterium]